MRSPGQVIVLDDGELEDVRALLVEMKIPFHAYDRSSFDHSAVEEVDVLVSTPHYAVELSQRWPLTARSRPGNWIVFTDEKSRTARPMLHRCGCNFVVVRPVHLYAIRLMLLRVLYSGREHRRFPRFPVGAEIRLREGIRLHSATLADLSMEGCRLVAPYPFKIGRGIVIRLTRPLVEGRPLFIHGNVVRSIPGEGELEKGSFMTSAHFDELTLKKRHVLKEVLEKIAEAPLTLREGAPSPKELIHQMATCVSSGDLGLLQSGCVEAEFSEMLGQHCEYHHHVITHSDHASRIVLGQKLSADGMQIEPHPDLQVGDELELALYGHGVETPIVVKAMVVRDQGEDGLLLDFQEVPPEIHSAVETLVISERAAEEHGGEGESMVLSEIMLRESDEATE